MKLSQQDLQKIADLTLEHYNQRADDFWEGTRHHDVSQNVAALLRFIENEPPFTILDFGCGPGRDLHSMLYGGSNVGNAGLVRAQSEPMHGEPQSLELVLPPLATALFRAEM